MSTDFDEFAAELRHTYQDTLDALELWDRIGGWERITPSWVRVKTSADGRHYLDVVETIFSWRLVTTEIGHEEGWSRGWCYFTPECCTKLRAFIHAVEAADKWDGNSTTEPEGFDKRLQAAP